MPSDVWHDAARAFIDRHYGQYLSRDRDKLVARCMDHLIARHACSRAAAERATLQTLGEVESRAGGAYLDLAHSSRLCALLVDPTTNRRVAFTAQDLLRLARRHGTRPIRAGGTDKANSAETLAALD